MFDVTVSIIYIIYVYYMYVTEGPKCMRTNRITVHRFSVNLWPYFPEQGGLLMQQKLFRDYRSNGFNEIKKYNQVFR